MKFKLLSVALAVMGLCHEAQSVEEKSNPAGQALAEEIRNALPEENSSITGVLKISSPAQKTKIPVRAEAIIEGSTWKTIYTTTATNNIPAVQIVVVHSTNAPNRYSYARAKDAASTLPELTPISIKAAMETSLAGSDFTIADLGLDFLHWPEQKRIISAQNMKLGRDCYLLESENPQAPEMVRVKSWIDKESNGLLVAEGYNAKGEKVKEFSLTGSSFKKIKGRWQLQRMTIFSPKKKSETVLEFDLPKD